MTILQRYKRLTFWAKLGVWGSVASIIGLPFALWPLVPHETTLASSARQEISSASTETFTGGRGQRRKAPTMTFRDGHRALVEFSVTTHIEEADAAKVVVTAGDAEKARDALDPKVVSTTLSTLEPLTLAEARNTRIALEKTIEDELRPYYIRFGLTLDAFSLKEFKEL
jgi:hypothetical protein